MFGMSSSTGVFQKFYLKQHHMVLLQRLLRDYFKLSLFTTALILTCTVSFSQSYLEVPVKVDVEKGSMDGVLVKVKKDGKDAFTQSGSSKMRLKLDFNKIYTLIFTKDGYITKTIEFDTHAPSARVKDGFDPYAIGVKLFSQENEKHTVVYNQAVGRVHYDSVLDEFNYDTDYSKSILSGVEDPEPAQDSVVAAAPSKESPVAETETKKLSKSEEKALHKSQKEEQKPEEKPAAPVAEKAKKKSSGSGANDVSPKGQAMAGNDPSPHPSGNGGNDNSGLIAMADGGDAGSGLMPSAGDEPPSGSKPNVGNERPANIQRPSAGAESGGTKILSSTGEEMINAPDVYDSQSITREDIVEDKRLITIVRVTKRNTTTEFRRVTYRWGGPYYFQDNKLSISETVFAFYTGVKD
jgi:hypothetical protein